MKELNIEKTLLSKRKELGLTQEELADFFGVSKASVSKWETGQSYPDITLLPQIAAYFNITIDELMGYSPQMEKEELKKIYHRLSAEFATKPFDIVFAECEMLVKKYYACFPLLRNIATLYMNHFQLAIDENQKQLVLNKAIALCKRVHKESQDVWLAKEIISLEAIAYLAQNRPEKVIALLGTTIRPLAQDTELVAQAHQLMGNPHKAIEAIQISSYQYLISLVGTNVMLMTLNMSEPERVEEILRRTEALVETYQIEKLHPFLVIQVSMVGAQFCAMYGKQERALAYLKQYTKIAETFFPAKLHGDSYYDKIEDWMQDFDLGTKMPIDEKNVRKALLDGVSQNPLFTPLAELPEYKNIINRLTVVGG